MSISIHLVAHDLEICSLPDAFSCPPPSPPLRHRTGPLGGWWWWWWIGDRRTGAGGGGGGGGLKARGRGGAPIYGWVPPRGGWRTYPLAMRGHSALQVLFPFSP